VTFDESGGTYDHVSPPTGVTPPDNSGPGEMAFGFDRLGMRVPMIWISSYLQAGSTVSTQFQHTSFMRFLRSLFKLPDVPLTNRDRDAPNIPYASLFGSTVGTWPTVTARNDTNPGSSNPHIDEMSYFVSQAQAVFQEYLAMLECDIEEWLGTACVSSGGGGGGLSTTVKEAIAGGAVGFAILVFFCYCCCCRNGGIMWTQCKACCCCKSATPQKKKPSNAVTNPGSPLGEIPL